jgi:choline dehydrogenase-like flavoprotein
MDGRSVTRADDDVVPDLCIVGAGPAGISIAQELDRLGLSVLLLEAGGMDVERKVQSQSRGESDGYPLHRLHHSRVRAFGGTLRHRRLWDEGWAARPLDAIDFEPRAGLADVAWPFGRDHVGPYYERAEKVCGLVPFTEASGTWFQDASETSQALVQDELEATVFQFPSVAFHDSWSELSASPDVTVLLHARVTDIELDASARRVARLTVLRADGTRLTVRPRAVVLAGGGIENARLLLTGDRGRGLGNEHGLVGRYFAERLSFYAGHVVLADGTSIDDLGLFHRPGLDATGGALRVSDRVQRERGLLNCAMFLIPRPHAVTSDAVRSLATLRKSPDRRPYIDHLGRHLRNIVTGLPDVASFALDKVSPRPRTLTFRVQGEQSPNPDSRVMLGSRRDDLGLPVARVTWTMNERDRCSVRSAAQVLDTNLREHGLGFLRWTADLDGTTLVEGNHHHLGTTRMHEAADRGVVDPDCKVHGVDNLYVAGSSVFPSHGASNPTLTIVALALRLADHLRDELEHA